MSDARLLAINILELFDNLLTEKGISVPCDDARETEDRLASNGDELGLYGMEYWNLADDIESLLRTEG